MKESLIIFRVGSLGDTVIALPFLHSIERRFPNMRRVLLTNISINQNAAPAQSVLEGSGLIQFAIAYPVSLRSMRAVWQLAASIRSTNARTLIYLMPPRGLLSAWRDLLFFKACGITRVFGVPLSEDLQRHRQLPDGDLEPERERLRRCLKQDLQVDFNDPESWNLRVTPTERDAANKVVAGRLPRRFIAINMGGKDVEKDWGENNWIELLATLRSRYPSFGLLVVGAASDAARGATAVRLWGSRAVSACGLLSARESAAALSRASLFIGHDSGPMHLASAVGVTCVCLFGSSNQPRVWHPMGDGHQVIHKLDGVSLIAVSEVLEAVDKILGPQLLG